MPTESSREAILSRIRAANGSGAATGTREAEWRAIPRDYRARGAASREEMLELLADRLRDYDAHAVLTARAGVAECVRRRLAERGEPRMIVPRGLPAWMLPAEGNFFVDGGLSTVELDGFAGVLTTATVAIAETGTLVLQNVPGQGRRAATLVPDYHLCVVDVRDVVRSVAEAVERLQATSSLPTTFVSGPSATADIEMTRIKGVHGPRFLDVVLFHD